MKPRKICVVGAGPAGMMAAIRAAEVGGDVTLLEKNFLPGKKLLLSGKGRCNLTNTCNLDLFLQRFSRNGEFLRDAFKKFFNLDLMHFFEKEGLQLKIERQLRVFPVTNRANSIVEALKKKLQEGRVRVLYKNRLKDIVIQDKKVKGILLDHGRFIPIDRVVLATGGVSFSFTGSSGDGLEIARRLGHRIVRLRPGLVPLEIKEGYPKLLGGLTLKNIRLRFTQPLRAGAGSEIGELLFTDFGISGPLVLSLSGRIVDWLAEGKCVYVEIDLKPALSSQQLNVRLLREFKLNPTKSIRNTLKNLLPKRLVDVFIEMAKIIPDKKSNQITQAERERLIHLLKGLRFTIKGARPLSEAMVTRGGISLKDINPRTMESRIIKGLYFAGEMIDVDADSGGFNLQAAFSTGYLAGESAALN